MSKPKCYQCEYRDEITGDAHSCCKHPKAVENELAIIMSALTGKSLDLPLKIKANPHGVRNGWFNWPVNFDPVWLENCDGFKQKEKNG